MIKNVTIGADPECFIINSLTGTVVSSIGLIPGEKGNPYVDPRMPKGFGLEIDNILAEFNIPPCKTKEQFIYSINFMKDFIRSWVKDVNPNYDIKCSASEYVPEDQLVGDEAFAIGCDPDYNAYTEDINPKAKGFKDNLRSGGFHWHLGCEGGLNFDEAIKFVKYFDQYVVLPSILVDTDTRRRSLYGKAGSFRLQPWGVECRALSSFMMSNDKLLSDTWDNVMLAIHHHNENTPLMDPDLIQDVINNNRIDVAKKLVKCL